MIENYIILYQFVVSGGDKLVEYWDVYDINGHKLGYKKRADEEFLVGEYHIGASLWIMNSKGNLLIQKRAALKKTGPNLWSITGGKVLAGESSAKACLRETQEEIGLTLSEHELSFLYRSVGQNMLFDDYIIIVDFPIDKAILKSSEVSEVKWTSIDEIFCLYAKKEFMYNNISDLLKVKEYLDNHFTNN